MIQSTKHAANRSASIDWLFAPHTYEDFRRDWHERAPLHIPRNQAGFYRDVFSLTELERMVYDSEVGAESLVIYKDGLPARKESFTRKSPRKDPSRDVIDPDRVSALFARGCSLVFDAASNHSGPIAKLTRELEAALRHRVNANVYATPANAQGFTAHYDTHDTMILQIEGTKRWRVYHSPVELPLETQPHDKRKHDPGEAVLEFDLNPGDLLYLPRGVMHEGKASDATSVHVTFGLYPKLWLDILREALDSGALDEPALRKAATPDGSPDAAVADALARVFSAEKVGDAAAGLDRMFALAFRSPLSGQLHQLERLAGLNDDSLVAIRRPLLFVLDREPNATFLSFAGKKLNLPAHAAALIHALDTAHAVRAGALRAYDERALETLERLIAEGFAVQCAPGESAV